MNSWLVGLLIAVGGGAVASIGCGLLAKFLPRDKCAAAVWGWILPILNICDKFLDLKVGNKTSEQVEESVFGTIGFVMYFCGQQIDLWLKNKDTDNSLGKDS